MNENKDYYNALPTGYRLEQYQIIKVLGAGGFGIAYLATDTRLDTQVVIKEYLPNDLSVREQSSSQILPKDPDSRQDYESGLKEYIKEARTIAKFDHPNIVQVKNYMEANNTAYIVMSYVQGSSLSELAKGETATEEEIRRILFPLLDGLKEVHTQGYLHRDIKPSNIFIQEKTRRPVLIDFGAARFHLGVRSKSMTSVVTAGYSPYEQYHTRGKQGAWTDIYAMGGVLYRLISGQNPPEAPERITTTMDGEPDPLQSAIDIGKGHYSPALLKAIDYALAIRPLDRPQSVDDWLVVMNDKEKKSNQPHSEHVSKKEDKKKIKNKLLRNKDQKLLLTKQNKTFISVLFLVGGTLLGGAILVLVTSLFNTISRNSEKGIEDKNQRKMIASTILKPIAGVTTATNDTIIKANGEAIYKATCFACHKTGVAGAPLFGNKEQWASRITTGIDALVNSVLNGKGAMPPKGGNVSLSDDEVQAAVVYMVDQAK